MTTRIIRVTVLVLAVATFTSFFNITSQPVLSAPMGPVNVLREEAFDGDHEISQIVAHIEFSAPHIESGTSGVEAALRIPEIVGGSGQNSFPEQFIAIGYQKTTPTSDNKLTFYRICHPCGAHPAWMEIGTVANYRTKAEIVLQRVSCPPSGRCLFNVFWFLNDKEATAIENVELNGGARFVRAGGGVDGDDRNLLGVAGVVGVRVRRAPWQCTSGVVACSQPWAPGDQTPVRNHGPLGKYFSAFWSASFNGKDSGNIQVFTDCHLEGNCTHP
jgi:hypothetical protein